MGGESFVNMLARSFSLKEIIFDHVDNGEAELCEWSSHLTNFRPSESWG